MNTLNIPTVDISSLSSAESMPRKPLKIRQNATEAIRLSLLLDPILVRELDDEAERMRKEDTYDRPVTRTDVVRSLIRDGLQLRTEGRASKKE